VLRGCLAHQVVSTLEERAALRLLTRRTATVVTPAVTSASTGPAAAGAAGACPAGTVVVDGSTAVTTAVDAPVGTAPGTTRNDAAANIPIGTA